MQAKDISPGFRSEDVAEIGTLHLVGNISPTAWCSHITNGRGNPDWKAIQVLAEILGWWRPPKDSPEGRLPKPRFMKKARQTEDGTLVMECPYEDLARTFNISRDMAKKAVRKLEKEGLVEVYQLSIRVGGQILNNVIHVRPLARAIERITPSPGQETLPFKPKDPEGDEAGAEENAAEENAQGAGQENEPDPYQQAASGILPAEEVLRTEGLGHLLPTIEAKAALVPSPPNHAPPPPTLQGEGPPEKQGEAPPTQGGDVLTNYANCSNSTKCSAPKNDGDSPKRDRTPDAPDAEPSISSEKKETVRQAYRHAVKRIKAGDNQPLIVAEFVRATAGPDRLPRFEEGPDEGKIRFGYIGKAIKEVGGAKLFIYRLSEHLAGERMPITGDMIAYMLGAHGRGGSNISRTKARQDRAMEAYRARKREWARQSASQNAAPGADGPEDGSGKAAGGEAQEESSFDVSALVESVKQRIDDSEKRKAENKKRRIEERRDDFWGDR